MRLLHVDAERDFSGGEVQVFLLIEGLIARGHECRLVAPPGSRAEEEAYARGVPCTPVKMRSDMDLGAVRALAQVFRGREPDLVHLHTGRATWLGGVAARRVGVPALTTRRMDRPVQRGWRTRWIYGRLVRHAVAISPAVAARLADARVSCPVSTIPSAVDPARLRPERDPAELRRELGLAPGVPVLLVLASLVRRKGIDVLLEALGRLEAPGEVALLVAGDGPERAALETRARALEGQHPARRVQFLGRRSDAAELLALCDVFCLPSRAEGLGVAALEALAAGRAVVASRVGGLGEVVEDGRSGLLVAADDPRALAGALDRLLADPELRSRLAAGGVERVASGYLAEQMVDAYEALYRRLLS